jgi:hypothetical protein
MVTVMADSTLKNQWEAVTAPDTLCSAYEHPDKSSVVAHYKSTVRRYSRTGHANP